MRRLYPMQTPLHGQTHQVSKQAEALAKTARPAIISIVLALASWAGAQPSIPPERSGIRVAELSPQEQPVGVFGEQGILTQRVSSSLLHLVPAYPIWARPLSKYLRHLGPRWRALSSAKSKLWGAMARSHAYSMAACCTSLWDLVRCERGCSPLIEFVNGHACGVGYVNQAGLGAGKYGCRLYVS
jgi:hypothetical protein